MNTALALLEFTSLATGMQAVDQMLKQSPIAVLRCGSVHPGRYLALVGGTVASTEEAHTVGVALGCGVDKLVDEVLLPSPHPQLRAAVLGERTDPAGDAVGVCEISTSPGLLRAIDHVLKSVPVNLVEIRLADDLGGHALAIFDGLLPDVQEGLELVSSHLGSSARLLGSALMPRVDETLRHVLGTGTRFSTCENQTPLGAETLATEV
ncbi:MAG: microcompartment protein CcmL/EutN [Candidatus Krumholzibacteriia bacterium]|jgi:microcompartment protein CcmL/EutN